jgi:hypothetical protein
LKLRLNDRTKNNNRREKGLRKSLNLEIVPHIPKGKQSKIHLPPTFPSLPKIQEIIATNTVKSSTKRKKRQLSLITSTEYYDQEAVNEICDFVNDDNNDIDFNNVRLEEPLAKIKNILNNEFKKNSRGALNNKKLQDNEYDEND